MINRMSAMPALHTGGRAATRIATLVAATVLALAGTLPAGYGAGTGAGAGAAQASTLRQAGTCSGTITPSLTEGPYYKAGSPERTSLVTQGMQGTKIVLSGYVYGKNCVPVANAWLDFWQADASGAYDNSGYTLRGHQYTGASGRYTLETVIPGEYPGRTEHIHVKVQAPGGAVLTTQLFFPGVAHNSSDSIYNSALLVSMQDTASGKTAAFNFVLNVTPTASTPSTPAVTATPALGTGGTGSSYTFKETGIAVSGAFWTAWQGGRSFADSLFVNGLPVTPVRDEVSPTDGKVYKVQWFERARFEMHPENAAPNNVLLGLLGVAAAQAKQGQAPFKAVANPGSSGTTSLQWFSQTGHTLGDTSTGGQAIAAFWTSGGGLSQFGLPISQPFMEVSKDDGKSYLVQYFERQRLEYHPENKGTRYEILLGRLGAEQVPK